jgi:hypothetical protein
MKKVKIILSFDVEEKDLQHEYVKKFISDAKSGIMRKEVEESAKIGNTPIENVNIECKIL